MSLNESARRNGDALQKFRQTYPGTEVLTASAILRNFDYDVDEAIRMITANQKKGQTPVCGSF